jgi:S1-C subfamily serine protease
VKDTAYEAHVAGTDPMTGIAVIKIDGNIFKPVKFGKSSALQQGHTVVAVGNPLGLRATISFGAVSGLNRTIKTESALYSGLFQYTAQVYPGDSGGLVLNSSGEAVGIIVATYRVAGEELQLQLNEAIKSLDELQALSDPKLTDQDFIAKYRKYLATAVAKQQDIIKKFRLAESGMSSYGPVGLTESLNFAIPADLVQKAIEQLKAPDHKVVRGVLGVKVSEIDDVVRGTLGLQKGEGLVIEEIIVDGPAAQAGLKTNDIIVSVDGKTVGSLLDMKVLMTGYKPGDKMKVVVVRGANRERKTIEATLGASQ